MLENTKTLLKMLLMLYVFIKKSSLGAYGKVRHNVKVECFTLMHVYLHLFNHIKAIWISFSKCKNFKSLHFSTYFFRAQLPLELHNLLM